MSTWMPALAGGVLIGLSATLLLWLNDRVLGFLDVFGDFDPALGFVLGGAVATTTLLFRFVPRRGSPVPAESFQLSNLKQVDGKLLGDAALFGIGWGNAGYCPGSRTRGAGDRLDRSAGVRPGDAGRHPGASCRQPRLISNTSACRRARVPTRLIAGAPVHLWGPP